MNIRTRKITVARWAAVVFVLEMSFVRLRFRVMRQTSGVRWASVSTAAP